MIYDTSAYDIAKIRELLLKAFTPEDLRRFCQDRPLFRPIVARFGPGMGLDDMVDRVIDYCRVQILWNELLAGVQQANPRQYARFAPSLFTARPAQKPLPQSQLAARPVAPRQARPSPPPQATPYPAESRRRPARKAQPAPKRALPWLGEWDWTLWGGWVLVTVVSWMVGGIVGWFLGGALGEAMDPEGFLSGLFAGLYGALVGAWAMGGVGQWVVLRDRIQYAGYWPLVSAAIAVLGLVGLLPTLSTPAIIGIVVLDGVARWLILKPQSKKTGWWLAAVALFGAISWILSRFGTGITWSLGVALDGALYGLITGTALVWILSGEEPYHAR